MTTAAAALDTLPGTEFPLGATAREGGTNFAVTSDVADGMLLCLFDKAGSETQIPMGDYDAGVWHAFVPGAGGGQAYGYRATGPYDPARGVRCNQAKLLLDPYARAFTGTVGALRPSAGALRGLPGGLRRRPAGGAPGTGRGDRSGRRC